MRCTHRTHKLEDRGRNTVRGSPLRERTPLEGSREARTQPFERARGRRARNIAHVPQPPLFAAISGAESEHKHCDGVCMGEQAPCGTWEAFFAMAVFASFIDFFLKLGSYDRCQFAVHGRRALLFFGKLRIGR